ncbi:D-xylulose 5-phosphate/D-fructose 6-phosphate phosphoketolase [Sodiomyces alkalinus F11]|uniref:D-xylulose 5-phosphate/D-fructose 6-phosphate phosphoketolase n=1 Tax=Sodiomyces alkalinus (strain CBS 110278 / VKM F-3762 / F11) TaxID=1314773 RepID=A0A3N2PMV4_SODAK|nr:D-xylulose 5-phosphate/D-fructose 6-phosphate phosphoketolase [Sodiomyces alkalinus F11]ROT35744.1 D-xylulose 5-phosphate/D-fructose 6-phosphate phosphoketolase [Sodiomyces alkalinus F11]
MAESTRNDSSNESLSPFGVARATIQGKPLSQQELDRYNDFFKASLYLCLGMIYLRANPLLREPLVKDHLKLRLLGHFGSTPGQTLAYMHFNRLIKKYDLNAIYISGPGHGAPAVLAQSYLEGVYSDIYPDCSQDTEGLRRFFKQFSFPGGIGSHATPETPGSIHEGGELGYAISHAFGAVFDQPDLIALTVVGDGEAETGPMATSWHSNKFLNPKVDGAVLPVLHLNGYKINNPTVLARISRKELEDLFNGYGWAPHFVEGDDLDSMQQAMAATLEHCVIEIRRFQKEARHASSSPRPSSSSYPSPSFPARPRWPMIILRTPKGWTAPRKIDGNYLEGFWRAHQVPITDVATNSEHLAILEKWMRSYEPQRLFPDGHLVPELRDMCPKGNRRMSANPVANGGIIRQHLRLPDFREYAIPVERSAGVRVSSMLNMAGYLRDVMGTNPHTFRLFGPDETQSNKLDKVYEVGKKVWMGEYFEEDKNGGNLSPEGRVMEILSEHTCEGWLEGYVLTGRHGLFNSYEPFIPIVSSMVNQHCKWIEKCLEVEWRHRVCSLNILLTAVVWRQDHNGFTHQDPGFLDVVVNKSPEVVRVYLPPDGNCLLSVMHHCFASSNYVNVIVADKQEHLQYLTMEEAIEHCTKGIGIWPQFSTDAGADPDVVMASCGDVSTHESIAAIDLLLRHFPELRIRCVNVVDLFKLISHIDHPHGLTDREWCAAFTSNRPIIFNFHSYPWLVHRLTYRRPGASQNLHVRGYKEKGNIDTPLELAIRNQTDRFSLAIDALDRIPHLGNSRAAARESLRNEQIRARNVAFETGQDPHSLTEWMWDRGFKK